MIDQAIILAGGFGTRLQHVLPDIPKPMAPVGGKPFLHYVMRHLAIQEIRHAVLSVGYKAEMIQAFFGDRYLDMQVSYEVEEEPLGTGGAVKAALRHVTSKHCFILNGDTLFTITMEKLARLHLLEKATVTMALKQLVDFDRYGTVRLDEGGRIVEFMEKTLVSEGLINGGVYVIDKTALGGKTDRMFSLEKDFFEPEVGNQRIFGAVFDDYFIDIGIQEDYERAQLEIG